LRAQQRIRRENERPENGGGQKLFDFNSTPGPACTGNILSAGSGQLPTVTIGTRRLMGFPAAGKVRRICLDAASFRVNRLNTRSALSLRRRHK
jgi:hypothetical protein